MNLEELRSVQRAERQKDSLQHLRDSFYSDVAGYVAQLKDERERAVAAADDPFASEDVRQLTDKIESTQEIANALYERRVGKVVKHASFAAADMAADEDGMTTEERDLFEDLVARIRQNRSTVLATLEGKGEPSAPASTDEPSETADTPTPDAAAEPSEPADDLLADALGADASDPTETTDTPPAPPDDPEPGPTGTTEDATEQNEAEATDRPTEEAAFVSSETPPADSGGSDGPPLDDGETASEMERTTLRITADVGTVYGIDEREYDLARDDVVMLPTTNAEPLLQKNAAERIE